MDFKKLAGRAKTMIDQRGGTERLKADATKLKDIAQKPGTLDEKRKEATDVLKAPPEGGQGEPGGQGGQGDQGDQGSESRQSGQGGPPPPA